MNNKKLFEIMFLKEANDFIENIPIKHKEKILYNIKKAQYQQDNDLFKKLTDEIWEFRTLFAGLQYRLLAFWDNKGENQTLVVATHGFIKKRSKMPDNELQKAKQLRINYFNDK